MALHRSKTKSFSTRSWEAERQLSRRRSSGLKILAADIDPVASFVDSKEVSKFNEQGFLAEYRRLEELLKSNLQQSYQLGSTARRPR